MRSFDTAWKLLGVVSTPVLLSAGNELVQRARYFHNNNYSEQASNNANQFANQILGELTLRKTVVGTLRESIVQNIEIMGL